MARIVSIIQFTGRAGSAVGSKGKNGKVLLRQYQPSVANPRTEAQMSQRAKIKLAAQVAGMLGEVGRTALIANGHKKTERGLLVKKLLKCDPLRKKCDYKLRTVFFVSDYIMLVISMLISISFFCCVRGKTAFE